VSQHIVMKLLISLGFNKKKGYQIHGDGEVPLQVQDRGRLQLQPLVCGPIQIRDYYAVRMNHILQSVHYFEAHGKKKNTTRYILIFSFTFWGTRIRVYTD